MSALKPADSRQRRNRPAVLGGSAPGSAPKPPAGLSAPLRRAWAGLWASPVGQLLDPVGDLPAVSRLFKLYVLDARLDPVAASLDPAMLRSRLNVAAEARLLESQLGLTPRSRLALGLVLLGGPSGGLDDFLDGDGDADVDG